MNASAAVLTVFPESKSHFQLIADIGNEIKTVFTTELINIKEFQNTNSLEIAGYLFDELREEFSFVISKKSTTLFKEFCSSLS